MIPYGYWFYGELFPFIGIGRPSVELATPNDGILRVRVSGTRYECFRKNNKCVTCSRVGEIWILESHVREFPHLNLYSVDPNDKLILITQDHIMPRSKGGTDIQSNLQTMCSECNNSKGNMIPSEIIPHEYVAPPMFPHLVLPR